MVSAMDTFDALLRQALIACALMAFPILAAATLVGTLVAIVQAATQIQEQTLTLLPKLAVVGIMVVFFGHAAIDMCARLLTDATLQLPQLARGSL